MWKVVIVISIVVIASVAVVSIPKNKTPTKQNSPVPEANDRKADFTANFEIYTNGTKRVFTAAMYHKLSSDVFIDSPDPSVIYVKKTGITWNDFFKTLPFSVSKDCLVTGSKETFCTDETKKLKFILNEAETPSTLDLEIKPDDNLQIRYEN